MVISSGLSGVQLRELLGSNLKLAVREPRKKFLQPVPSYKHQFFDKVHIQCNLFLQKTSDEPTILIKNNIAALRRSQFSVTRMLMNVTSLPAEVPGFEVNMENVAVWAIREMRLHGLLPGDIVFNLKIDGRPFFGKSIGYCILFIGF